MKKLNQTGSHILAMAVFVVVIGAIVAMGYLVSTKLHSSKHFDGNGSGGTIESLAKDCSGSGTVPLTHEPMNLSDVKTILPIGTLAGAHVTPIDHLYFYPNDMKNRDAAPVYAMADGYIVGYEVRGVRVDTGESQQAEYQLYFQHSCTFYTYYDLMTSLDPTIKAAIDEAGGKDLHIPVKSGQVVGRVGAQSLDTAVYNFDLTLKGFANPDSYKTEPYKLHTDDFFKYFSASDQADMLTKNPRKFAPYGGQIDYDIPGKLIGNWFVEGTNGYAGEGQRVADSSGRGYWSTHLAIVPDAINQGQIDLSFGDYNGQAKQFTAASGTPNPATISAASGLTKYEYTQFMIAGPSETGTQGVANTQVLGTALFQISSDGKLKMETFPGKIAAQVTAFTSAAKTYVR